MTGDRKLTYAIALVLSDVTAEKLNTLRTDYQQLMDYIIIPHITLVYPFSPVFSLFQINEQLYKVARKHRYLNIVLNHIDFFENGNNVIYAGLENTKPVKKLHTDIVKSLESSIQYWNIDADYNLEKYIPHVTIGAKIPDDFFPEIKKKYSRYRFRFEETITQFILFSDSNGTWERKRVYQLVAPGKQVRVRG
jgi:2'-5' RNA ligase